MNWTQLVLSLASTCAVLDTTRLTAAPDDRPGYRASVPHREAGADRKLGDLARADRKRRETEQQASRREAELTARLQQRELRA